MNEPCQTGVILKVVYNIKHRGFHCETQTVTQSDCFVQVQVILFGLW